MRVLEAISREEKEVYRRKLAEILIRADQLDAEMLAAIKRMVRAAAKSLVAEMVRVGADGTEWDVYITPQIMRAVDDVAQELAATYKTRVQDFLPRAYQAGDELAVAGIGSTGLSVSALPAISPEVVQIAAVMPLDLITGISEHTRTRVQRYIQQAFLVGDSPHTVMTHLARGGIGAAPWKSVAYKAEIVTRTEMARVQGLAAQKRMESVARDYPESGLKMAWLVAHIKEWPCQQCAALEGKTWDIGDPEAPTIPLHPG